MQGTVKNRSENPVRHSGAGRKPVVDVIAKRLSGVVAISYLYIHLFGRSLFDSTVPLTVLLWRRCRKATEEDFSFTILPAQADIQSLLSLRTFSQKVWQSGAFKGHCRDTRILSQYTMFHDLLRHAESGKVRQCSYRKGK